MAPEFKTSALPVKGVLFDLDNTLFDRDLAFNIWASGFVGIGSAAKARIRAPRF